jgi:hypothetical protein
MFQNKSVEPPMYGDVKHVWTLHCIGLRFESSLTQVQVRVPRMPKMGQCARPGVVGTLLHHSSAPSPPSTHRTIKSFLLITSFTIFNRMESGIHRRAQAYEESELVIFHS